VALAREVDVSVYEGCFVALAEAVGAEFVTADERLARRLEALPFVHSLGERQG
jgi:predicted nucleic acid-binding protein